MQHSEIMIIIINSIFKENNVFSMTVNPPYGSPVNTDFDYCRTFTGLLFVSFAMSQKRFMSTISLTWWERSIASYIGTLTKFLNKLSAIRARS